MPTYSQVSLYRGQGKTFSEIGDILGISRQRVHAIFTGYVHMYRNASPIYKVYKNHQQLHINGSKPKKPCRYCEGEN